MVLTYIPFIQWPEQQVDDIDRTLNEDLKQLERETIEVLLSWESGTARTPGQGEQVGEKEDLSTTKLVEMLEGLNTELEDMELWLSSKGDALKLLHESMLEIEAENNRLEMQWKNFSRLNIILKPIIQDLALDSESERILRDPDKFLQSMPADGSLADRVDDLIRAAKKMQNGLNLIDGTEDTVEVDMPSPVLPKPQMRSIPKRLKAMSCLQEQTQALVTLREDFLEKSSKYLGQAFMSIMKVGELPTEKRDVRPGSPTVLDGAGLQQYQRTYHTRVMEYDLLVEAIMSMVGKNLGNAGLADNLLKTYGDATNVTLYRPLVKLFFQQPFLKARASKEAHSSLSSLPRANILDKSPVLAKESTAQDDSSLSGTIKQALLEILPIVKREKLFLTAFFRLNPEDNPDEYRKVEDVLNCQFDRLKEKLTEKAEAAEDADPFEGLAVLANIKETLENNSSPGKDSKDRFMSEMLISLQTSLAGRFNKFVLEQETWIQHVTADSKRAGILAPFAKFPSFVDRLVFAVKGRSLDFANTALQKLSTSLFAWLEKISDSNPKYADVVKLENYHFYAVTMNERQAILAGNALSIYIEQARNLYQACVQRYLTWMFEYQFPSLTTFFNKVEDVIAKVGMQDVRIHVPKINLQKAMESNTRKVIAEGLLTSYKRLRKHISDESNLFNPLWSQFEDMLFIKFSRYEEITSSCYDFILEPSAISLRLLARECASHPT